MKAYRASSRDGSAVTAETPRAAAQAFFAKFPGKRKCNVIEGTVDGVFFSVRYGRASLGQWPQSWSDITPKTAVTLPHTITSCQLCGQQFAAESGPCGCGNRH